MKRSDKLNSDLEDFFRIRFENKIAIRPRREDCHLAAATRLLAKKHELEQVGKEVDQCQVWYNTKMDKIAAERGMLEEREKALKNQLLKFDKFLRENESKRHRGLEKIKEEHQHQVLKDQEIARLNEELRKLNNRKHAIQEGVNKNSAFLDFMTKAVEASDDYEEIHDILCRCEVLWATKQYLEEREQQDNNAVEAQTLSIVQYSDNCNTEILRLNNLMSELQARYDQAQRDVMNAENNWTRIKNTAAKKTLLLGRIKMAVHNLYQLCNRYHQARILEQEEVVVYTLPGDQLKAIRSVMEDIAAVYKECKRPAKHNCEDHAPVQLDM